MTSLLECIKDTWDISHLALRSIQKRLSFLSINSCEREKKRFNINTRRRRETSGDDRRASVSKKTRPRRASTATPRKDSIRPTKTDVKQTRKIIEDAHQLEQTRRHRRIAIIVLGIFIFLLTASILAVVITLTHSTFLSPVTGSKELAKHRAQRKRFLKVFEY